MNCNINWDNSKLTYCVVDHFFQIFVFMGFGRSKSIFSKIFETKNFFVVISQLINSTCFFVVIWAYLKIFDHKQTGILLFSTNCNSLLANKPFETVISEIRNFFYNMSILSSFCEEWKRIQWCLGINAYFYRLFLSKAIQTNRFAQILNFFAFI